MLKAATKNAFKIVENLPNYYGEEKNAWLLKRTLSNSLTLSDGFEDFVSGSPVVSPLDSLGGYL